MDNVLIVSSTGKGRDFLCEMVQMGAGSEIRAANSGAEARRMLLEQDYDIVLINAPLQDEYGHELSLIAATETYAGIILICKGEHADEVSAKVEDAGVLVLPKPLSRPMFFQALKMVSTLRRRMYGLHKENLKLHQKIEEIRLVDRAKCVLMQYLSMTEPEAHRYLEKQAMNLRVSRAEVAQSVLRTYEA